MKFNRYGSFQFSDFYSSWLGISILLLFSIAGFWIKSNIVLNVFPIVYAIVWLTVILLPFREKFEIKEDSITVIKGRRKHSIDIPSKITIIVSDVDICPPFAVRTAFRNNTHVLKNKYAITILKYTEIEDVLEVLHRNHVQYYTSSMIEYMFSNHQFIYSFVCNQNLFEYVVYNRDSLIIMPESHANNICFDTQKHHSALVYVDKNTSDGSVPDENDS